MMPPVGSVPHPNAAGVGQGRRSIETAWAGEKRRKSVGAPSPPLIFDSSSSNSDDSTEDLLIDDNYQSQVQEEEEIVFSADDVTNYDEAARCFEVLESRERYFLSKLDGEGERKLLEHLARLRYREFKLWKESDCSLDDTTDTVPVSELPDEVWNWEDPLPGGAKFGWTFDRRSFGLAELDDYQRIVLTCAYRDEYPCWDAYCSTFSTYEADDEYVKFWDELFKKIKWIEEYVHLDRKEFAMYKFTGRCQAMKIAESFCHLPASLAIRGYNEYIHVLVDEFQVGCARLYLALWKRVVKQNMSFNDALDDILTSDSFPPKWLHRINYAMREYDVMLPQEHIEEYSGDDDDDDAILNIITDVLATKFERPKWYVDYVKKKLEVA
ncbi:unnamed protein product [Urochloa humidicola]